VNNTTSVNNVLGHASYAKLDIFVIDVIVIVLIDTHCSTKAKMSEVDELELQGLRNELTQERQIM